MTIAVDLGRKATKTNKDTITNIEVIRQNVFSHARVMVIGVSSDLKKGICTYAILKHLYIAKISCAGPNVSEISLLC